MQYNPSPARKANDNLARATFYTDCAKVKAGLALGVRVDAVVGHTSYFLRACLKNNKMIFSASFGS